MAELLKSTLVDCLEMVCSIHGKKHVDQMDKMYYAALSDLDNDLVVSAFQVILDDRYFPTPARIRELTTGVVVGADWHTITAVATGAKKSAIISGVSANALVTAVTSSGLVDRTTNSAQQSAPDPVLTAIKKIAFCDDPFTLREIRKDWLNLVGVASSPGTLAPADVEITLATKPTAAGFDREYPRDDDYTHQTAAMIRVIDDKKAVSVAWLPIVDRFPAARKAEVMAFVEANNFATPVLTSSNLYKKYLSVGEAMREINESEVNALINVERRQSREAQNGSKVNTQQQLWQK